MKTYICVYLGAALLALLSTPLVIRVAHKLGLMDACDARKVHTSPIPRLGGLVIVFATLAMSIPVLILDNVIGEAFRTILPLVIVMLGAGVFMAIIGFIDDTRGLPAHVKLMTQILAALGVCAFGIRIESITLGEWFRIDFGWMAWGITVFWIVGITNAVDFIDGLVGLAAGISAATCGVIAIFAFYTNQPVMAVIMLALMGALTGFLRYNLAPAKIFMGDCGSLFLGFVLATSSVMCAMKSAALVGLGLPALALGLPIFDTLFSIVRRVLQRRSVFAPDRSHIHHRLLEMGLRQHHAVVVMYLVTLAVAGLGLFMMATRDVGTLVIFACALVFLVLVFRITGTVHLQESIINLRQCLARFRQTREERRSYENAEIRLLQAKTLDTWWEVVSSAAKTMDFARLSLSLNGSGGEQLTSLAWCAHPEDFPPITDALHFDINVTQESSRKALRIEADIPITDSLESAARKAVLFGRLIDRSSIPEPSAVSLAA
ncbi:MAG: glycosyltransferase family 4 protein [Planctomycetota bacterium]|jgi:UDP-GlcNAc:undecaprenyl-phosphate GlcNAc-1-phosphate transferase